MTILIKEPAGDLDRFCQFNGPRIAIPGKNRKHGNALAVRNRQREPGMDRLSTILLLLGVLVTQLMFILGKVSEEGDAPGITRGKLSRCSDRSNCACSEFTNDPRHYIEPVAIPPHINFDLLPLLRETIKEIRGTVRTETGSYMAATFSSSFFKFIDDFEIRIDRENNIIHVRSASRVGYSDIGVNRKRIELFKSKIEKAIYMKHVFNRS